MSATGKLVIADQVTRADLDQMEQYKRRYFGEGLTIPSEIVYRWHLLNPDTLVVVRDAATGEVVGHLHVVPIVDSLVEAFTRGDLGDDHLTVAFVLEHPDIVRSYDEPGPYVAYLSSVAVHPDYANTHALRLVLNAYADILMRLAGRGIFLTGVFAHVVSAEGDRLTRLLGFEPVPGLRLQAASSMSRFLKGASGPVKRDLTRAYEAYAQTRRTEK